MIGSSPPISARMAATNNVPMISVHHAQQPEIELTSTTTATGVWPMADHLWWSDDSRGEFLHGYGHYYEDYRKVDVSWIIAHRKLTRLRVDATPDFYDRLNRLLLSCRRWGTVCRLVPG